MKPDIQYRPKPRMAQTTPKQDGVALKAARHPVSSKRVRKGLSPASLEAVEIDAPEHGADVSVTESEPLTPAAVKRLTRAELEAIVAAEAAKKAAARAAKAAAQARWRGKAAKAIR